MSQAEDSKPKPRFSILRPAGDLVGEIPGTDIKYEDLWRHDEYIHANQFNKVKLAEPEPPKHPQPPHQTSLKLRSLFKSLFLRKMISGRTKNGGLVIANWAILKKLAVYLHDLQSYKILTNEYRNQVREYNRIKTIEFNFNQVKKKANFTCHFCGFVDKKYLEIHHIDGNHFNHDMNNLLAACTLCHRQHHLLWLSINNHAELGLGNLNFMPQTELNHIQRIAIVKSNDEKYSALLGINGKLGIMINAIKDNFSRPLHAFMISAEEQAAFENKYKADKKLKSANGKEAKYSDLETALENLNNPNPTAIHTHALGIYDEFIGMSAEKKNDQNASDEEIRQRNAGSVREQMQAYMKELELKLEEAFNTDINVFSIFELAVALKSVDYDSFKEFDPPNLYLIFNESVFTKEQLEYYRKQQFFNVDDWDAS